MYHPQKTCEALVPMIKTIGYCDFAVDIAPVAKGTAAVGVASNIIFLLMK